MMIFHGLPFVFQFIMMNPGFVSSGNIFDLLMSKTLITDHCLIRNLVATLITNEHYCLRASNIELKLSTNILHCIDYRPHAQTFLSFHY